ncbi:hypothetical protein P9112_005354 [Eukaryota sp. TZLM1-RC]
MSLLYCVECKPKVPSLVEDHRHGNLVCKLCGLVSQRGIIDTGSEWRSFSDSTSDTGNRVGGPSNTLFGHGNLTTTIGEGEQQRGRRPHLSSTQSSIQRALVKANNEMEKMGTRLGCNDNIKNRALEIFHLVRSKQSIRGRPQEGIIAACLYHSFAEHELSRSYKEISCATTLSPNEIGKNVKFVRKVAGLDIPCGTSASHLVPRFCNNLRLEKSVTAAILYAVKECQRHRICMNRQPSTVASAVIHFVCQQLNKDISMHHLVQVCDVAEPTVISTSKELAQHKSLLIPESSHSKV